MPDEVAEKMQWSIGYVQSLMKGESVPTVATVRVAPLFGDGPTRAVSSAVGISGFEQGAASARAAPAAAAARRADGTAGGRVGAGDDADADEATQRLHCADQFAGE